MGGVHPHHMDGYNTIRVPIQKLGTEIRMIAILRRI
jgi:hypothetical protein